MEAYVSNGLAALSVDEDLCEYFVGMMGAMGISLSEEGSEAFEEAASNLVELLVDGYACDEPEAREFVTGAPEFAAAKAVPHAVKPATGRRAGGASNGNVRFIMKQSL